MDNVYTMQDWKRDKFLKVKEGQYIDKEVYYDLLNSVPPVQNGACFQVGEAYSFDFDKGCNLYTTFERHGEDKYMYIGLKPAGYNYKQRKRI